MRKNRPWPFCQAIFLGAFFLDKGPRGLPFPGETSQSGIIAGTIHKGARVTYHTVML